MQQTATVACRDVKENDVRAGPRAGVSEMVAYGKQIFSPGSVAIVMTVACLGLVLAAGSAGSTKRNGCVADQSAGTWQVSVTPSAIPCILSQLARLLIPNTTCSRK